MRNAYRSKQYRRKFEEEVDSEISHTSYALYYHLVWSVKGRYRLIDDSMKEDLATFLEKKCKELKIHLLGLGINPEHVHLIIALRPVHSVSEIVKRLKGSSAREINRDKRDFVKWTRGYSVRSISEGNLKTVINYVKNQEKHHQTA